MSGLIWFLVVNNLFPLILKSDFETCYQQEIGPFFDKTLF